MKLLAQHLARLEGGTTEAGFAKLEKLAPAKATQLETAAQAHAALVAALHQYPVGAAEVETSAEASRAANAAYLAD